MSVKRKKTAEPKPDIWTMPYSLPIVQGKDVKKNCCKKFKKGKRCKRCPN